MITGNKLQSKFWLILIFAFLLRIFLSPFGTLELDFNTFRGWSAILAGQGFEKFYEGWSDYLPGYLYVLWVLGKLSDVLAWLPQTLLYKFPAILADVVTGALIFSVVSRYKRSLALFSAGLYLFNPAVIFNSTLWGQIDSLTILFIMTSLFFAPKKPVLGAMSLALGTLIKPQAAFIAPVVAVLWIKKFGIFKTLVLSAFCFLFFVFGFIPFKGENSFIPFILERLGATANQYPYTSVNAFNFWAIIPGMWKSDVGRLQIMGILLTAGMFAFLLWKWFKERGDKSEPRVFLLSALCLFVSFFFLTRMHERHLLPTLAPLAVSIAAYPMLWLPYIMLSITYVLNLLYSFVWINENFRQIFGQELISILSLLNLIAAGLILVILLKSQITKSFKFEKLFQLRIDWKLKIENRKFSERIPDRFVNPLLVFILGFALLSRVAGLWHPSTFYFDEVYHAWTAREMLHGNAKAWEWWNTPPEGFAYEWTHPPLAKLGMMGSMQLLGEKPLGWRLPGAILGTGAVFLVYLLGVQLFKNKTVGLFSAAAFSLDGLPLVMSRIGMNDSYFLFFALSSILFFLKRRYFWSSVFLGLAASSKWTFIWVIAVLFLIILLFRQKPRWGIFWFLTIPPIVYLASYIPFFTSGHTLDQFVGVQQQMWWYHTGLKATHGYQSAAWTWPFDLRPVWVFVQHPESAVGLIGNIYILGNPIVFWGGLVSLGGAILAGIKKRQAAPLFIAASWGLMFLPWVASPRVMFLYHYLPAIPFLSLAFGWFLAQQKLKIILISYFLLLTTYIFFLPHWTGVFIPQWLDNLYYIFPNWK